MSLRPILTYPDPRLYTVATPVDVITDEIKGLTSDLFETMYHGQGCGLAATQVDAHVRIFVMNCGREQTPENERTLINPEIIASEGKTPLEEGCLSVPGFYKCLKRAEHVTVRYQTLSGETIEESFEGLAAVCVQHEIDHLNGEVFVDKLSGLSKRRFLAKWKKLQRMES